MFKILSLFQSFEFSLVTLLFERWDVDEFPSCLLRVVSYRMTFTLKRKWKCLSCVWLSATPWTIQTMEFSRPDPGVSSLSLLQGTFPTQGSNPGLLHCRWILHQLSCEGSFLHYQALTKVIICFGIVILLIGLPFSRCRWVLCSALVLLLQSLNSWVYSYYCCYYYFNK